MKQIICALRRFWKNQKVFWDIEPRHPGVWVDWAALIGLGVAVIGFLVFLFAAVRLILIKMGK